MGLHGVVRVPSWVGNGLYWSDIPKAPVRHGRPAFLQLSGGHAQHDRHRSSSGRLLGTVTSRTTRSHWLKILGLEVGPVNAGGEGGSVSSISCR